VAPDFDAGPGTRDAGDASALRDAGPCGVCEAATPICIVEGGEARCVKCGDDDDCGGDTPVCNASHDCVECADHSDCTHPEAAQCMGGVCVPCSDSSQCTGTGVAQLCDTTRSPATCVECTSDDASHCAPLTQTCDLLSGACSDFGPMSRLTCETCTNDLQCPIDHRCILMEFPAGTPDSVGHCLKRAALGCGNPYRVVIEDRESISGADSDDYCGVDENQVTCEAVLALQRDDDCTMDGACGDPGSETPTRGAICRNVGGAEGKCTYACGTAAQCPTSVDCGTTTGYCGGI
jgi:hypothetical protein